MSRAKLTRNQLAAFLPTPEAVKAFEQLLSDIGITLPDDVQAVSLVAEQANTKAQTALEQLADVRQAYEINAGNADQKATQALQAVEDLKESTEVNSAVSDAKIEDLIGALNRVADGLMALQLAPRYEPEMVTQSTDIGIDPPNVKQNADLGLFPMQWPTKNPRGNGSWADLWVPQQYTFVDNVLSLRNQSRDAGGTIYGLAAICCLDAGGTERGAFGYSRNSAIQPAGYTPDIVYVEFGDPFSGDANPSSFQLICTMAGSSAWFPGTTFVAMEHITKTGATIVRARGGQPISLSGGYTLTEDLSVGYKGNVKQALGGMTNTCWRIRERDNTDSAAWTTNINDAGTQDDATKSSWKVKIGYGNTDDSFKVERAPAGSSSFTNFLKITNGGKFGIGNPASIGEYVTTFTGSDEYAYSWAKTGSKKWALGSYVGGSYLTNATDSRKHIQNLDTGETLIFGGGLEGMRINTSQNAVFKGTITHADNNLMRTSVALSNGAAAATGTLTNAPVAGNPTKWIPINDNGTTRYIPAW